MNYFSMAIGLAAIGYGLYTLVTRWRSPDKFWKLKPMREKYGETWGTAVHVIGYSVLPIVFGATMLLRGFLGISPVP